MHKPFLANRLCRWLVVLMLALLSSSAAWAQSTANYAFSTSSTGSLVDMSSGTTDALATGSYRDDDASTVQPVGFTFVFMGTPYTQFSVNSNGQLRLGATAISGINATPSSGAAILGAFGGDNAMQSTGRVAYKVVPGTNRQLVVEWTGLRVPFAATPAAGTPTQVQVVLEENTGKIEYRYGTAYNNGTSVTRAIFISAGTSAGQIGVVKTFNATPTYDATVTSATTTTLVDNAAIAGLSSTADGSRTVFTFAPTAVPAAPTVALTAVTQTTLTVSITDNSTNEYSFSVLRSADNVTFTSIGTVTTSSTSGTGGTVTLAQAGLTANTTYYYKVAANGEGYQSFGATATVTTLTAVPLCGTKSVGPGADYPTLTAAFTAIGNNGLCGPLVLELQAAYVSTTETFPLTYSYAGTATNTVTVRPAAGATNLSITGTAATAVLNIAGGKYFIIDGRPGGSGTAVSGAAQTTDLTIGSTSTSGIPLQFTSDATFNTVQHVQIKGVGTSESGSPDVNFTGTVTTTGNSDNTVQYCNIGDGATTPVTLIYGGSSLNARNSILNNNLFNNYGTGSTYGIYLNQTGAGWTISGNSLYQTASRVNVSGTMYGIFINANNGHTVAGNFVGGSAPSLGGTPLTVTLTSGNAAAAYRFAGIYLATTTGTASNVQGNAVGNITWVSSSGAATTYGILAGIYVSSGDVSVGTTTGNTVGGAAAPITVTGTTSGGYAFGISTASSGAVNITGNTISTITGVGAAAVAVNVTGILASTGSPTISRNKIYNLAAGSAASGTVATLANGIWLTGGTTTTVTNNLIGDLRAATSTSLVGVTGIQISGGTTHNLYYNTLYLSAASNGSTFGTSGIYLNSTSATLDVRNNIVVNKSTAAGTGGYTAALRRISGTAGTAPANLATTTNNNLYYAGTPSATNLIYVEGTTTATNAQQTIAAYKTFVATRESNSVTEDVPFLSTTGTAATFLHVSTTTPTQVEGNATPISSVTTDFDGDTRSATTPDLGADEGTFQPLDLTPPTITFTALGFTANTTTRTLAVTITDASGISTATPPRLFFRKGTSGAFTSVLATSTSGSVYTFTFNYAAVGGVAVGDVIQYYVAAQDTPGNASSNPAGGTFGTAPASVFQFAIAGSLSGVYYVGSGTSPDPTRTYATLTAAANAYNTSGLSGAVTFLLLDATYSTAETFPVVFGNNPDASATNLLTIKPNTGVTSTISGATSLLAFQNPRFITLDGSNAAGGTSRDLTLTNTSTTSGTYHVLVLSPTTNTLGSTNMTVRNVSIVGGSVITSGLFGIVAQGADNDNLTVQNNSVVGVTTGIQLNGTATVSAGGNDNTVVQGNTVGPATAATATNIGTTALYVGNAVNATISGNTLQNVTSTSGPLGLNLVGVTGGTVSGNTIRAIVNTGTGGYAYGINLSTASTGLVVDANRISGVVGVGTGGYGGYGIRVATGTANSNLRISNNFISDIQGTSYTTLATGATVGLLLTSTMSGVSVYYNSVSLTGIYNYSAGFSVAFGVDASVTGVNAQNNIFANSQVNSAGAGSPYAFYSAAPASAYTSLNYNDYYSGGAQATLAYFGSSQTTLAALRTATGKDQNSISADPLFVSATDLHVSASALNNVGTPVAGITTDFDGETRSTTTPDIGADEFTPAPVDIAATALTGPAATGCYSATESVIVTLTNNATAALNFALNPSTVTVTVTKPDNTTQTFTTTLNTGTLAAGATRTVTLPGTLSMTASGTYSFAVTTVTTGDGNTGNDNLTATRTVVGVAAQPQLVTFTGFTGANLSTVFPGWTEATGTTLPTGTTSAWTNTTGVGGTGNTTAKINLYSTGKNDWIVSPKFLATNSTVLTFDAGLTDYNSATADPAGMTGTDDFVEVRISTDCGQTFARIPGFAQFNAGNQPSNGSLTSYSINLSAYAGQSIILGFFASEGTVDDNPDYDFHLDNISVSSPLPIDLTPVALLTPTATQGCYTAAETVTVSVRNLGTLALDFAVNPATVTAVVTTPGGPQTLTATVSTGTLAPGAVQTVTLAPTLNMSAVGTYSFAITATVTGDQVTGNDALAAVTRTVVAPVAGTVTTNNNALCISGTTTLTLTGAANGSIQWQQSADNVTFTDISGATSATYTTAVLTSTTYFRAQVRCGTQPAATSNVSTITVSNPLVAGTNTPLTICSGSTATLTATASPGASIRFFSAATGGTALAGTTGGSYTTPALTASTTYYAEAFTGSQENVGKVSTTGADGANSSGGLYFTTTGALTIANVTVYRMANAAAGTATIYLLPGSTTSTTGALATVTVNVPANTSASVSPTVLALNFAVPAAGSYTLYLGASTPNLIRDTSGSTFPYTSPSGAVSITNGSLSGYYYFFYNWQIGSECASAARTAVQVNVTSPATASFPAATASTCGTSPYTLAGTVGGSATAGTYTSSGTGTFAPNATTLGATYTPSAADVAAGTVTITLTSTAVGTCPTASATLTLGISPAPVAMFSYPTATAYCAGSTSTVTPTLGTGATAGSFSSTAGLSIDPFSGIINLSTSTAGTYTVTNTVAASGACAAATATATVTITPAASAAFSYPAATFCVSGTTAPAATVTGTAGGTFASTTGLTINATTGAITLASSTPGTYTVTYTVAGACGASSTQTVTITAAPVATFSYATTSACAGSTALLTPTLGTGATAGTFTSTAGLTINATTGAVNPATSTAGTYTVTNTVAAASGCAAATSTATVTINALPATPTVTVIYPTRSTALLTSSTAPAGTTYQWYLGGVAIAGATSQTYTANGTSAPGAYSLCLISTATGCRSCSSVTTVTATAQPLAGSSLNLFPNPTADGKLTLQLSGYTKAVTLTVVDALGRVVLTKQIAAGQAEAQLDLSGSASGVYTLRAVTEGGTDVRRIVRQ
jgi:hypothetical protein